MSDGTRTRDHLDHNQVLYQLSYTHRGPERPESSLAARRCGAESPQVRSGLSGSLPNRWAMDFAVAVSGPGGATNTAAR